MELQWKATDPDGVEWIYDTETDWDDDGWNYESHIARNAAGEMRYLSWSRFETFGQKHFTAYVEAGMPPSPGIGPWYPAEIEQLAVPQPE